MYQRIIITSGVSLILNNCSFIKVQFQSFFETPDLLTDKSLKISDEVIKYLVTHLKQISNNELRSKCAEISMVSTLQNRSQLSNNPYVTLFYTDTFKGRIAGFVIKSLLEKRYGATVKLRKVYELDVNNRPLLNRSLGKYLSDVSDELREGEPRTTCFAPIGGYKVMTSLGYLVGAIHKYPSSYLHEGSSVIHEIPAVNVEVDESFIIDNHNLLKKFFVGDYFSYDKLSAYEKDLVNNHTVYFEQEEGLVALNPFGRFLCDQGKYYKYFKSKVFLERSIKEMIDRRYANYWKDVYHEIKQLMYQHSNHQADYRSTLYHESDFSQLNKKKLTYHLFKGGNHPIFRAVWKYDETEDRYLIFHIWFDHDEYERQAVDTMNKIPNTVHWMNITDQLYAT